jgi:hypothetical protein
MAWCPFLENGFDSMLITACTYLMRRFAMAVGWLQAASKNSCSDLGKLIAILLSIPCFKISNLCFKVAYLLQQRELIRLGRKCAALGGEDYSLPIRLIANHAAG